MRMRFDGCGEAGAGEDAMPGIGMASIRDSASPENGQLPPDCAIKNKIYRLLDFD